MDSKIFNSFNEIKKIDNDFTKIIEMYGFPTYKKEKNNFRTLMKIIIGQQISKKSAESIYKKLINININTADDFLNSNSVILKKTGLSSQKINYVRNLAIKIQKKDINLSLFRNLPSETVYKTLIGVKGIGKWTINNYQLFVLQDLNAWPSGDLALQEAIKILKNLEKRPNEKEMNLFAENWVPYRGSAALLLWHFRSKRLNND